MFLLHGNAICHSCCCIIFAFAPLALHHVALSSDMTLYVLHQVHVKQEIEVQAGQAQVKAFTNLTLDQGKPRCATPNP
jgi:hypothetical protein